MLVSLAPCFAYMARAEGEKIISTKNEYGGKTSQIVYSPGKSTLQDTLYYNGKAKLVKMERTNSDTFANQEDWAAKKTIEYYDSEGRKTKKEFFFSPYNKATSEAGVTQMTVYYDSRGREIRGENIYTDTVAKEKGCRKIIMYEDGNGNRIKNECVP